MTSSHDDLDRDASGAADDQSLVEHTYPMSSYPAFPGKQVSLAVTAAVLVITMFLPWWDAEIPLDRVADTLNGWLLFATGLSIGSLGSNTGYTWFGNVLFGLVPTIPVLVLIVLIALRVLRIYVAPASALFLYSLLGAIGSLWLLLYGTLRINASNGIYPVLAGPWIVLVVSLALCTLCILWWRTERLHFPKRKWSGIGSPPVADDPPPVTDTDDLFAGIDDNDQTENEQLSIGRGLGGLGGGLGADQPRGDGPNADSPASDATGPEDRAGDDETRHDGDRHDGDRHDGDRHDGDRHDGDRHDGDRHDGDRDVR